MIRESPKALTDAANELSRVYRQLTQATYYAVDGERPELAAMDPSLPTAPSRA